MGRDHPRLLIRAAAHAVVVADEPPKDAPLLLDEPAPEKPARPRRQRKEKA